MCVNEGSNPPPPHTHTHTHAFPQIFLWVLKDNELTGMAFIDTQLYIHQMFSIKNFILAADLMKSVSLFRYQQESKTLSLVSRVRGEGRPIGSLHFTYRGVLVGSSSIASSCVSPTGREAAGGLQHRVHRGQQPAGPPGYGVTPPSRLHNNLSAASSTLFSVSPLSVGSGQEPLHLHVFTRRYAPFLFFICTPSRGGRSRDGVLCGVCSQGELRGDAPAAASRLQRRRQHQHVLAHAVPRSPGCRRQEVADLGQQAHHLVRWVIMWRGS